MLEPVQDDREEFEQQRREHIARLGTDDDLKQLALHTTVEADRNGYSYVWKWLGLPVIQMPTDIVALQEVVWDTKPQAIIETGIARGGSLILFASLLELLGQGRVIGIDVDIRPHNREAIESHRLSKRVTLVEGSSVDPAVLQRVASEIEGLERVMVVLDSDHVHDHVLAELHAYGPLVTPGQFLVVADTIVEHIPRQEHRPRRWGPGDNPHTALRAFLEKNDDFELDPLVNQKLLMSSSPDGYLRRKGT